MRIEDLNVNVRPRSKWESVDLGVRMIQNWGWSVYKPLLILLVPFWLLALLLLPVEKGFVFIVALWWLKPLWGRIPLYVISRAMFGKAPSTKETLKAIPGMMRHGFIGQLTVFRFSPNRALNMPVILLENLKGKARSKRARVINSRLLPFNFLLCCIFLALEWVVLFEGLPSFLDSLYPEELLKPMGTMAVYKYTPYFQTGFYLLAVLILEPFFVAAGFALYLNTRTVLECWDIELAFKKMRIRFSQASLFLLFVLGALLAGNHQAIAMPQDSPNPEQALEEVMAHPDFGRVVKQKAWRFKGKFNDSKKEPVQIEPMTIGPFLAEIFRYLFWGLVIVLLTVLLYFLVKALFNIEMGSKNPTPQPSPEPEAVVREKIILEGLPVDIVKAAKSYWEQQDQRLALSTLFRGALKALTDRGSVVFGDFATEEECLRLVRKNAERDLFDFFKELTRTWQSLAYAHRPPDDVQFHNLCTQWLNHLGVVK